MKKAYQKNVSKEMKKQKINLYIYEYCFYYNVLKKVQEEEEDKILFTISAADLHFKIMFFLIRYDILVILRSMCCE